MTQTDQEPPVPVVSRGRVARDMLVFQLKLFADGFKDLLMSPLSLIAGLMGIFLSRGNPGAPLYELFRTGKRVERWINLFAAAYRSEDADDSNAVTASDESEQDLDRLVNQLEATLLDQEARARLSDRSKKQLEEITRKWLGERKG